MLTYRLSRVLAPSPLAAAVNANFEALCAASPMPKVIRGALGGGAGTTAAGALVAPTGVAHFPPAAAAAVMVG